MLLSSLFEREIVCEQRLKIFAFSRKQISDENSTIAPKKNRFPTQISVAANASVGTILDITKTQISRDLLFMSFVKNSSETQNELAPVHNSKRYGLLNEF